MKDRGKLRDAIREIGDWFEQQYTSPSGFPWAEVDGSDGRPLIQRDLSSELDDYLPLLRQAGRHDYADRQVERVRALLTDRPHGLYDHPQARSHAGLRFRLPGLPRPRYMDLLDMTEILFGLVESRRAGGSAGELDLARRFARHVLRHFERGGELRSWRWTPLRWTLPVMEPLSGMIVEALCDLAELTGEEAWLEPARRAVSHWIDDPVFRRHGVFRSLRLARPWDLPGRALLPACRRFELVKANTSMIWGLLALYRLDPSERWRAALEQWLGSSSRIFRGQGALLSQLGSTIKARTGPILSTNFAVIDLYCDLAAAHADWRHLLKDACRIADVWIDARFTETDLLPDELGVDRSYLDGNCDLAVSMMRLTELTGMKAYREEAERTVRAVLRHHRAPWGYLRDVRGSSGEPISHLVETRFVSLLLKPLLLLDQGLPIYAEGGVASLMRDR